jgi:Lon protease-like protein
MSIRTRFEIETFLLGAHPTKARQAQQLVMELEQAKLNSHPDLVVLQAVYDDFAKENDVNALIADIETSEEEYWVQRLARLAAIDILTIGKVQPEHMNYMASLSDTAFTLCVKHTATLAKTLNDQVREVEAELSIALSND